MAKPLSSAELHRNAVDFTDLLDPNPTSTPTTEQDFLARQGKRLTSNVIVERGPDTNRREPRTPAQIEWAEGQEMAELQTRIADEREQEGRYQIELANRQRQQAAQLTLKKNSQKNLSAKDVIRNSSTAWGILSVWSFIWSCFQLPLSVASIVFLAIGAGMEATWIGSVVSTVASGANAVTSVFGADFSALAPTSVGLSLHFLLLGLLSLGMLATMFTYVIRGQNPLFESYSEAKIGALIIAFIGYSLPLINLFPWIGIYMYVMWKSPR